MHHAHRFFLAIVLGPAFLMTGPGSSAGTLSRDFSLCSKLCVVEQQACDLSCSDLCVAASGSDSAVLFACNERCKEICFGLQDECLLKCRTERSAPDPLEP